MKIEKVDYALGSNKLDLKKYLGKNFKRVFDTTGIKKTYHSSKNEDIISLATKASKKVIKDDIDIDAEVMPFVATTLGASGAFKGSFPMNPPIFFTMLTSVS